MLDMFDGLLMGLFAVVDIYNGAFASFTATLEMAPELPIS